MVAGSKSFELTFELERRGFAHVAATANCGRAAHQYDVALVDWRRRPLRGLESLLRWVTGLLKSEGVLLIWTEPQKSAGRDILRCAIETCGFVVERDIIHQEGFAVSARFRESKPIPKAA